MTTDLKTARLRPDLPPLPDRIAALPVDDRGYPVPWFVAWVNGKPEFRCADTAKLRRAIVEGLCWVCGQTLGRFKVFVLGPMCSVNRVSAEGPCHLDCATFSVQACPFLSKPQMVRRENDMPEGTEQPAGFMIRRNPGATALWTTREHSYFGDGQGGILFHVGEPTAVTWWKEGRAATREEVLASIDSGFPLLMDMAIAEGPDAVAELEKMRVAALRYLP